MNFWSVFSAANLSLLFIAFFLLFFCLVVLLYFKRGKVILWLLGSGSSAAEYLVRRLLKIAGVTAPQWVLVAEANSTLGLGLIIDATPKCSAVFLPASPSLIPGKMVFVPNQKLKPLSDISLKEGIEALLSFGSGTSTKVLAKILAQVE